MAARAVAAAAAAEAEAAARAQAEADAAAAAARAAARAAAAAEAEAAARTQAEDDAAAAARAAAAATMPRGSWATWGLTHNGGEGGGNQASGMNVPTAVLVLVVHTLHRPLGSHLIWVQCRAHLIFTNPFELKLIWVL